MSYLGACGIVLPRGYTTIMTLSAAIDLTLEPQELPRAGSAKNLKCGFIEVGPVDRPGEESGASMEACPCLRRLWKARAAAARSLHSFPDVPLRSEDKKLFQCLRRAGWPVRNNRGRSRNIQ